MDAAGVVKKLSARQRDALLERAIAEHPGIASAALAMTAAAEETPRGGLYGASLVTAMRKTSTAVLKSFSFPAARGEPEAVASLGCTGPHARVHGARYVDSALGRAASSPGTAFP